MDKEFLRDRFDWLQAELIDIIARKCSNMSLYQREKLSKLLVKAILPFKFCRKDYVTNIIMETLGYTHEDAEKLMIKSTETFVLNSFEMASLRYMTPETLNDKIRVEGLEYLKGNIQPNRGVVVVSGHFGLWEFLPQWLTLNGFKMTSVARIQKNKYVDKWFNEMRERHGAHVTDSGYGLRDILKALHNGHILGLMMDQDNGKQGIFMKFMGKWASAPTGPAVISMKLGSPIIPIYVFPNYEGKHLLKIFPPIDVTKYEKNILGQQKLTQDYNSIYEEIIRKTPEQWFWLHKRWKTQPVDCPENPSVKALNIDINN